MSGKSRLRVLIAGTFQDSEGYPNVRHKIEIMRSDVRYETRVIKLPVCLSVRYQSSLTRFLSLLHICLDLTLKSVALIAKILFSKKYDVLYIPYPAVYIAWLLGMIPAKIRPSVIVLDAFISLYDTVVIDRELVKRTSFIAKIVRIFERRAFNIATVVLTDTEENSKYYSKLLSISESNFTALTLSIDEEVFNVGPTSSKVQVDDKIDYTSTIRVLFVGTMVPLHGIDYLCAAIHIVDREWRCKNVLSIEFIGSGQADDILEELLTNGLCKNKNVQLSRKRDWMGSEELALEIKSADLCLGIFGQSGKAHRVWPLKNYCYLACGKPLITGTTPVSNRFAAEMFDDAFVTVDLSDPSSLSSSLMDLAGDVVKRQMIGDRGREFYLRNLSHKSVSDNLYKILYDCVSDLNQNCNPI